MAHATLVEIARGEDLLEALKKLDVGHDAWLQAVGEVEDAELRVAGDAVDPRRAVKGRATLLSLQGPAGGPWAVILARAAERGMDLSGGLLLSGRSAGVRVAITALTPAGMTVSSLEGASTEPRADEAVHARTAEPAGSGLASAGFAASAGDAAPAGVSSWARLAQATADAEARRASDDDEGAAEAALPKSGDYVQHARFGLCQVVSLREDRMAVRDCTGPGRMRQLALTHIRFDGPQLRHGKRVFSIKPRG